MFIEKVQGLTAFPQELIYHFVAETPEKDETKIFESYYIPSFMQFNDVLDTYLHLQNTVLPELRGRNIAEIEIGQWKEIFLNINRSMLKTLASHMHIPAGVYRDGGMVISRRNSEELQYIMLFLAKKFPMKNSDFLEYMVEKFEQPAKKYDDFLKLLASMDKRTDITLRPSSLASLEGTAAQVRVTTLLERLNTAYLTDTLTAEQKDVVEELMVPCIFPEELPALMEAFFIEFKAQLDALDKSDTQAVAQFMAFIFQQVIKIHPFANGNGRTSMCFINLLLQLLEHPAICFYHSLEKHDDDSDYGVATNLIFKTREPMVQLILNRLQETIPIDETGFAKTRVYINLSEFLLKKHQENPERSIDNIFQEANRIARIKLGLKQNAPLGTEDSLRLFQEIPQLTQEPTRESIFRVASAAPDVAEVLNQYHPHANAWKFYPKNQCALLICHSKEEADGIARTLNEAGLMTASASFIKSSGQPVVQVANIQLENLLGQTLKIK
ncbi:MAG TPA: hypothetical protein DCZ80_00340 [Legionellales bacterium]|nr:hypothetical protein [Legionellales bacterium]